MSDGEMKVVYVKSCPFCQLSQFWLLAMQSCSQLEVVAAKSWRRRKSWAAAPPRLGDSLFHWAAVWRRGRPINFKLLPFRLKWFNRFQLYLGALCTLAKIYPRNGHKSNLEHFLFLRFRSSLDIVAAETCIDLNCWTTTWLLWPFLLEHISKVVEVV